MHAETASSADPVLAMIAAPERALPPSRRSPRQAALLAQARAAEAAGGADAYWAWAAGKLRWMRPWDELRSGGFGDARWFSGGLLNVCDNCVDRHAENPARAGRKALIWEGEPGEVASLTYRELRDAVARCANGFKSLGIGAGDVVALYLPNLLETMVAIHACNRIGAIYTILFAGFSPEAVALRLQTARAKLVITADANWRRGKQVPLLANVRQACATAPSVQAVVVVDRCGTHPQLRAGEVDYARLLAAQSADCPCVPVEANSPAFLIFTSGTESKPKGIVHSAAGFLLGAWANVQWQAGLEDDDIYWCATDVGWLTFPIQAVIGGLAQGGSIVCYEGSIDTPTRERFYQIAERHQVTKILTAPTVLRMLRALGDEVARQHPLPLLKLVTVQGEPLDAETFHWTARALGDELPVINAYGQTETGATWTYPVAGVDALKGGSCGRPVPGHACTIVDDAGQPVPDGVKGNLLLSAPFPGLARTIWDDHERFIATYFKRFPGYYSTSDEAIRDHDGHLWVLGRADDVINVAAHRISTMEIESIAAAQPGVADAAVVGVKDALKGSTPVAFLSLRAGADAAQVEAAVRSAVERGIGGIARLEKVYFCCALPKTRAGKTMRRLLREAVETGAVRGDVTGLEDPATVAGVLEAVRSR
jgi:acetyl-CoA synthetase